jgi:hypothetical protein
MHSNDETRRPTKIRRLIGKIKEETGLTRHSERLFHAGIVSHLQRIAATDTRILKLNMCHPATMFCGIDIGDLGWGCGYRNMQMLLSAVYASQNTSESPHIEKCIPSILELQQSIEAAWTAGFDIEGAGQLSHKLLKTRKWIGTTEVYALMSFWGYDVELLQLEGQDAGLKVLLYCKEYFESAEQPLPLYFQHSGHSRTIVGILQREHDLELVVFDPAMRVRDSVKNKSIRLSSEQLRPYTIKLGGLKQHAYQLLRVGGILSEQERKQRKTIRASLH